MRLIYGLLLTFAYVALPGAGAASTAMRASEFQEFRRENKSGAETMLSLIEDGFGWANAELANRKRPKLYCAPFKMAITNEQLGDILDRYLDARPNNGQYPVGLVLLKALQEVFPCGSSPTSSEAPQKAPRPADRRKWQ